MDYNRKRKRNLFILLIVLLTAFIGCGMSIGLVNLIKFVLFFIPSLTLLPAGYYWILMHYDGRKQFFYMAIWIGFVFSLTSIVGMLIDPRAHSVSWGDILGMAGLIWLGIFTFICIFMPLYIAIFNALKRTK
jgi:hypothetical protein